MTFLYIVGGIVGVIILFRFVMGSNYEIITRNTTKEYNELKSILSDLDLSSREDKKKILFLTAVVNSRSYIYEKGFVQLVEHLYETAKNAAENDTESQQLEHLIRSMMTQQLSFDSPEFTIFEVRSAVNSKSEDIQKWIDEELKYNNKRSLRIGLEPILELYESVVSRRAIRDASGVE